MNRPRIYLWEGRFLFIGGRMQTRNHTHHALQIGIPLKRPFLIKVSGTGWRESHGVLIAPDREHECLAMDEDLLYLSLDPESREARRILQSCLQQQDFSLLTDDLVLPFKDRIMGQIHAGGEVAAITATVEHFLLQLQKTFIETPDSERWMDPRIERAISAMQESLEAPLSLQRLSTIAGVSEGRMVHLFKHEVGIPIRRYYLWLRMNRAFQEIVAKKSLTEAAHSANFSDQAHFSRTFSRMFGVAPSEILKNSQIIQVYRASA